jgi:hypothetical protein
MKPGTPLERFLAEDHVRLDDLLTRSHADDAGVARAAYESFRSGLLRHIAFEEKFVMPHLRRAEQALPLLGRLRADHSALAALLIPNPRSDLLQAVREILHEHNRLEEEPGGMYELAARALGAEQAGVMAQIAAMPDVKVSPHRDGPTIEAHIARVLSERKHD